MYIQLFHRTTGQLLGEVDNYEGLSFSSIHPGGFATCSFSLKWSITYQYPELEAYNEVKVWWGTEVAWQGYIDEVAIRVKPDQFDVSCLGWSARLNEYGETDNQTEQKGSTYIAEMLEDDNCLLAGGDINTDDYTGPDLLDIEPYTTWNDLINMYWTWNESWHWGVWEDRRLYWEPLDLKPAYYASKNHCDDLTITPGTEGYCNQVLANYTQDGTHYEQLTVDNEGEQERVGRVVVCYLDVPGMVDETADGEATDYATIYLNERSEIKPKAEFSTKRLFDNTGASYPLALVRAGKAVRLLDFLPMEIVLDRIDRVDEITTFTIKEASFTELPDRTGVVSITPTEYLSRLDVQMARLEAYGYRWGW